MPGYAYNNTQTPYLLTWRSSHLSQLLLSPRPLLHVTLLYPLLSACKEIRDHTNQCQDETPPPSNPPLLIVRRRLCCIDRRHSHLRIDTWVNFIFVGQDRSLLFWRKLWNLETDKQVDENDEAFFNG